MSALPLIRHSDAGIGSSQAYPLAFLFVLLIGILAAAALWRLRGGSRPMSMSGATWGWRQMLSSTPGDGLRLLDSIRLTSRASVHVVQWEDQKWLLACTGEHVTSLSGREQAQAEARPSI